MNLILSLNRTLVLYNSECCSNNNKDTKQIQLKVKP